MHEINIVKEIDSSQRRSIDWEQLFIPLMTRKEKSRQNADWLTFDSIEGIIEMRLSAAAQLEAAFFKVIINRDEDFLTDRNLYCSFHV